MAAKQKTSDVMNYFFKTCPDDDNYRTCKNPTCANRDLKLKCKQGSGYTNLRNHLIGCIGLDYVEIYEDIVKTSTSQGKMESYGYINKKEKDVYKTLEWLVMRNHPITEIDHPLTRGILNTADMSSKAMRQYILQLIPHILLI